MSSEHFTKAQVLAQVNQFLAHYNGNIPLEAKVEFSQEELYGPDQSYEKTGFTIYGAYHGHKRIISIPFSNIVDRQQLQKVLRHELLGHYGLNTFKPSEKKRLLEQVALTENEPSLQKEWRHVKNNYGREPMAVQSEELFAHVAENDRSFFARGWDRVRASFQNVLRNAGLAPPTLTLSELRVAAAELSEGIRLGALRQQTFPTTDAIVHPAAGKGLMQIDKDIVSRAATAAKGLAEQKLLQDGYVEQPDDEKPLQPSVLLERRMFQGEQIGWDCRLFEVDKSKKVAAGAMRVFPSGFALVAMQDTDGGISWQESDLSADSPKARQHLQKALAEVTCATSTRDLSLADVDALEAAGWTLQVGRKIVNLDDPKAYWDTTGEKWKRARADNDVINVTVQDEQGRRMYAVAWYDKANHMRKAMENPNRYPAAIRETATALFVYVDGGCPVDVELYTKDLQLGHELFGMLSPAQQATLRSDGIEALERVLLELTAEHGSNRPAPASRQSKGPSLM